MFGSVHPLKVAYRWFYLPALLAVFRLSAGSATISIAPSNAGVRAGETRQFRATTTEAGSPVQWRVNGVPGGNAAVGFVSTNGLFTAPSANPGVPLWVEASVTNPPASITAVVAWENPQPILTAVMPPAVNVGTFSGMVSGTGFAAGAQVEVGGVPVASSPAGSNQLFFQATITNAGSLAVVVVNPAPGPVASHPLSLKVMPPITVKLHPAQQTLRLSGSAQFAATLANALDLQVTWSVDGRPGGDAVFGWIDANGFYTAPLAMPGTNAVVITAASVANPAATASVVVTLLNPEPVIRSVTPSGLGYGAQAVLVTGTGFVTGSQLEADGVVFPTLFGSPTSLSATVTAGPLSAGALALRVVNPAPGGSNSPIFVVPVAPAEPKVSHLAAGRFLEQAGWGPDAAGIAHLQDIGFEAWLDEQLAAPASSYLPSTNAMGNLSAQQAEFFAHALNNSDVLRQRVAFSLGQIFVVSGVKTGQPRQMAAYQNILLEDAFGSYAKLLQDVTLSPTMGVYLDMVDNDKANPAAGTAPNENYGREVMQLFSIGTVELNLDGTLQLDAYGRPIPTYGQAQVSEMARALTGWTFPGAAITRGHNPPRYDAPMISVEANHDAGAKQILGGYTLPAGQTALEDLEATLRVIAGHPNVAPFISVRLIQHLVASNPSTNYVGRISRVFVKTQGDLSQVVRAILLDPEARQGDDPAAPSTASEGHLREPVLYLLGILRAFDGGILAPYPIEAQGAGMGEELFYSPSVFNYYSPLYRVPDGLVGPEFQLVSSASSLLRANSMQALVVQLLEGAVELKLDEFSALASSPADLVDAVDHALLYGRLPAPLRTAIISAVTATPDALARARMAIYLVATSGLYQVQH